MKSQNETLTNSISGSQFNDAHSALAHMVSELNSPHTKPYADILETAPDMLSPLLRMLYKPLYQHGLMMNQSLLSVNKGTDNAQFSILTTFYHIPSGTVFESISSVPLISNDKQLIMPEKNKLDFYRRYALYGVLGIVDENIPVNYNS
ncbi:hypothetical protein MSB30_004079 [Salmonella enterica]|nr:hypothetical protein [Salmonella enterica subsp. diarizonae]EDS5930423.1 hypothetical protein [Salmonella enterica subsp. enterica serovar Lexington]EEF8109381.1 hypothetical protein [Salmonella enterica subsp. enterica serovar Abony]EHW6633383.1 hypothetical protein [Salmonella enterica]EIQ2296277.1 hypothetical protein [Salmonella enterica subsp. enterica serovar Newport]